MRFAEYFYKDENDSDNDIEFETESLSKNKSKTNPPKSKNKYLEQYLETISNQPFCRNEGNMRSNINQKETNALSELQNNNNIIIKEADKGGAVVIMDSDYYEAKIMELLNDPISYKRHG